MAGGDEAAGAASGAGETQKNNNVMDRLNEQGQTDTNEQTIILTNALNINSPSSPGERVEEKVEHVEEKVEKKDNLWGEDENKPEDFWRNELEKNESQDDWAKKLNEELEGNKKSRKLQNQERSSGQEDEGVNTEQQEENDPEIKPDQKEGGIPEANPEQQQEENRPGRESEANPENDSQDFKDQLAQANQQSLEQGMVELKQGWAELEKARLAFEQEKLRFEQEKLQQQRGALGQQQGQNPQRDDDGRRDRIDEPASQRNISQKKKSIGKVIGGDLGEPIGKAVTSAATSKAFMAGLGLVMIGSIASGGVAAPILIGGALFLSYAGRKSDKDIGGRLGRAAGEFIGGAIQNGVKCALTIFTGLADVLTFGKFRLTKKLWGIEDKKTAKQEQVQQPEPQPNMERSQQAIDAPQPQLSQEKAQQTGQQQNLKTEPARNEQEPTRGIINRLFGSKKGIEAKQGQGDQQEQVQQAEPEEKQPKLTRSFFDLMLGKSRETNKENDNVPEKKGGLLNRLVGKKGAKEIKQPVEETDQPAEETKRPVEKTDQPAEETKRPVEKTEENKKTNIKKRIREDPDLGRVIDSLIYDGSSEQAEDPKSLPKKKDLGRGGGRGSK